MTVDEMVTEILRLHEACKGAPSTELVHIHTGKTGTVARIGGPEAVAPGIAAAVSALRDKLRAEAAVDAAKHEARASVLRAALGERDPSQALADARERLRCAEVALEDLLGGGQ